VRIGKSFGYKFATVPIPAEEFRSQIQSVSLALESDLPVFGEFSGGFFGGAGATRKFGAPPELYREVIDSNFLLLYNEDSCKGAN
jgi:hypothetical protein